MDSGKIILGVATLTCVASVIVFAAVAHYSPQRLAAFYESEQWRRYRNAPGWGIGLWMLASYFGAAAVIWFSSLAMLAWIPVRLGVPLLDDGTMPFRDNIAVLATSFIPIIFICMIIEYARCRQRDRMLEYVLTVIDEFACLTHLEHESLISSIEADAAAGAREDYPAISPMMQRRIARCLAIMSERNEVGESRDDANELDDDSD